MTPTEIGFEPAAPTVSGFMSEGSGARVPALSDDDQVVPPDLSDAMLCVSRFHEAFNLPRASRPQVDVSPDMAKLRVELLREEMQEFADATTNRDIIEIADALADIVYVAYGAAVTYGIDLDAVVREVHRANMSKLNDQGLPEYREDGKVLKAARYTPPDVAKVLACQPPLPF